MTGLRGAYPVDIKTLGEFLPSHSCDAILFHFLKAGWAGKIVVVRPARV